MTDINIRLHVPDGDEKPDEPTTSLVRDTRAVSNPRKELVREQLIDIAAELFDTKGYNQTGINEIAKAIGLGRSAVYHYFRNKEEILAALVESEALTPSHQLQELQHLPGLTAAERLRRAIIDGIVRRLSAGSRFILLSRLEAQIPDDLMPLYNRSRRHIYDFYVEVINEGIQSGEFRTIDAKIAAFAVIGMANWTSRWYSPQGAMQPAEIGAIIADFAVQSLLCRHESTSVPVATIKGAIDELQAQIDRLKQTLP